MKVFHYNFSNYVRSYSKPTTKAETTWSDTTNEHYEHDSTNSDTSSYTSDITVGTVINQNQNNIEPNLDKHKSNSQVFYYSNLELTELMTKLIERGLLCRLRADPS